MGAFYGSVQVRSDDHAGVLAAAEAVARARSSRMLVAAPKNGWIGVFPDGHGQDQTVAAEMARRVPGDVLHVTVHDNDVFAYWLFCDGEEIDSYWSNPGYFGDANIEAERAMTGNSEVFRPLLGAKVDKLGKLLGETPLMASEKLEAFAKLLKIPNALEAYEYLKEEGRGRSKFVEVPAEAVVSEKERARQEKVRRAAVVKRLMAEGRLLARYEAKDVHSQFCAVADGFLVARTNTKKWTVELAYYREPWAEPAVFPVPGERMIRRACSTGSTVALNGDKISVGTIDENGFIERRSFIPRSTAVEVALSADGSTVAFAERDAVVVADVTTGAERCRLHYTDQTARLALSPDGKRLALGHDTLIFLDVEPDPKPRTFFLGGRAVAQPPPQAVFDALAAAADPAEIDRFEKELKAEFEKLKPRYQKSLNAVDFQKWEATVEKTLAAQRAQAQEALRTAQSGYWPAQGPRANERIWYLAFTRDGRRLYCGTDHGFRVFDSDAFIVEVPRPVLKYDTGVPAQTAAFNSTWVYCAMEDGSGNYIFASHDGTLREMNTATGIIRAVRIPGEKAQVFYFGICGSAIGFGANCLRVPFEVRGRHQQFWEIWSQSALAPAP